MGVYAADEMGIPVVINMPGPLPFLKNVFHLKMPDFKNARTCCGCICVKETAMRGFLRMVVPHAALEKREAEYINSFHRRSCLINSFWGLDPAESVPPNFVHTGPLSRPAETLMEDFKTKDNDLLEWMNKALEDKQPVVLITIGSECKWQ